MTFSLQRLPLFILGVMPIAMAIAHRSAPFMLVIAALLAVFSYMQNVEKPINPFSFKPTFIPFVVLIFIGFACLSLLWSPLLKVSAFALGELLISLAAGVVLLLVLPKTINDQDLKIAALGLCLAAIVILADLFSGLKLRTLLGMRDALYIHNRPVLTLLVLSFPVLSGLWRSGHRRLVLLTGCLVVAAILKSESGAARLGLCTGVFTFAMALIYQRLVTALMTFGVVVIMALSPFMGVIAGKFLTPGFHQTFARAHTQDRVNIWQSFGAVIAVHPLIGSGFGTSAKLDQTPVKAQIVPDLQTMLAVGHPHNAPLQIWVELGAIGALLATVILLALLLNNPTPSVLGVFAAAISVSLVGHGAWQGWWWAAIMGAVIWLTSHKGLSDDL